MWVMISLVTSICGIIKSWNSSSPSPFDSLLVYIVASCFAFSPTVLCEPAAEGQRMMDDGNSGGYMRAMHITRLAWSTFHSSMKSFKKNRNSQGSCDVLFDAKQFLRVLEVVFWLSA